MNHSGFFLAGVLVGVLIAAACGLDLFPEYGHRADRQETAAESSAGSASAGSASAGRADAQPSTPAPSTSAPSERIRALEEQLAEGRDALVRAGRERERLQGELLELRRELETRESSMSALVAAEGQLVRLAASVDDLRSRLEHEQEVTIGLLRKFFGSPRLLTEARRDAALVLEYFATGAPDELRAELVDHIREANPQVLAELAPRGGLGHPTERDLSRDTVAVPVQVGVARDVGALVPAIGPQESRTPDGSRDAPDDDDVDAGAGTPSEGRPSS